MLGMSLRLMWQLYAVALHLKRPLSQLRFDYLACLCASINAASFELFCQPHAAVVRLGAFGWPFCYVNSCCCCCHYMSIYNFRNCTRLVFGRNRPSATMFSGNWSHAQKTQLNKWNARLDSNQPVRAEPSLLIRATKSDWCAKLLEIWSTAN